MSLYSFFFWKAPCPVCKSDQIRRSRRSSWERRLMVYTYRCVKCDQRWYRLRELIQTDN